MIQTILLTELSSFYVKIHDISKIKCSGCFKVMGYGMFDRF